MSIGSNVKKCREEKGLSQRQLAEVLCVTQQTVSQWENDVTVPQADRILELAKVLDTSVISILIDRKEDEERELRKALKLLTSATCLPDLALNGTLTSLNYKEVTAMNLSKSNFSDKVGTTEDAFALAKAVTQSNGKDLFFSDQESLLLTSLLLYLKDTTQKKDQNFQSVVNLLNASNSLHMAQDADEIGNNEEAEEKPWVGFYKSARLMERETYKRVSTGLASKIRLYVESLAA